MYEDQTTSDNEIHSILASDDPGIVRLTERQEQQIGEFATAFAESVGDDEYEKVMFDLIEAYEPYMRKKGNKASTYCLTWLDEQRERRERGFE